MSNAMNNTATTPTTRRTRRGTLHGTAIVGISLAGLFGITAPMAMNSLANLPTAAGSIAAEITAEGATDVLSIYAK